MKIHHNAFRSEGGVDKPSAPQAGDGGDEQKEGASDAQKTDKHIAEDARKQGRHDRECSNLRRIFVGLPWWRRGPFFCFLLRAQRRAAGSVRVNTILHQSQTNSSFQIADGLPELNQWDPLLAYQLRHSSVREKDPGLASKIVCLILSSVFLGRQGDAPVAGSIDAG